MANRFGRAVLDTWLVIVLRDPPLVGAFDELARQLENAQLAVREGQQRSGMLTAGQKRQAFLQSVAECDRQLKLRIPRERLDSMLRSRMYFAVMAATSPDDQIAYAMNVEYDRLAELLEAARQAAIDQQTYWSAVGELFLPDTSYWVDEWRSLAEVDYERTFNWATSEITLVVPMVVVDELDGVAHRRSGGADVRAKKALRFIQANAGFHGEPAPILRPAGGTPLRVAVVDSPPDHLRRPINDDEIVACADQLATATGKKVTLVSSDSSGFELRARLAGQQVITARIPEQPSDQQAQTQQQKQRR